MLRSRPEPDPLKARRRQLAEQERLLAERMSRLTQELNEDASAPVAVKKNEPPVWRLEEETAPRRAPETVAAPVRVLGRQRQRDMIIFFLCTALLVAICLLVAWLWKTHVPSGD
jgi:hypothetical protein